MTTQEHPIPTEAEIRAMLTDRRNWGRWGKDDQRGALNLITPKSRLRALAAVKMGVAISLSRPLPTWIGAGNSQPAEHYMKMHNSGVSEVSDAEPAGGWAADYYGIAYHGVTTTHIDALCHVWDGDGIYNGRNPEQVITYDGATFGDIEQWADGIFTRAVMLDVPKFRGTEYVTEQSPVMGWELAEIAKQGAVNIQPGDAVVVYSGREKWQAANPESPYGRFPIAYLPGCTTQNFRKPGLHASCLAFLRDNDISTLVWDMLDATPCEYGIPFTVHSAIHAYGTAVVDNALLEPIANACSANNRVDFLLIVSPLVVSGGTGSPVNPIAVL
jgi:kynurenine formamidase